MTAKFPTVLTTLIFLRYQTLPLSLQRELPGLPARRAPVLMVVTAMFLEYMPKAMSNFQLYQTFLYLNGYDSQAHPVPLHLLLLRTTRRTLVP